MRKFCAVAASVMLAVCLTSLSRATVIETIPHSNTSFGDRTYASPVDIQNVGQIFQLMPGDDTVLDAVSVWVMQRDDGIILDFSLYLYRWDGSTITGAPLFQSPPLFSNAPDEDGIYFSFNANWEYGRYTVDTNNLQLDTGVDYAFFLSTFDCHGTAPDGTTGIAVADDDYANGPFLFSYLVPSSGETLETASWHTSTSIDLLFRMDLSPDPPPPVPEPASILLLASALAGCAGFRRASATLKE